MKFPVRWTAFSSGTKWLILIWLITPQLVNPWVRGDGVGYYANLDLAALLDGLRRWTNDRPAVLRSAYVVLPLLVFWDLSFDGNATRASSRADFLAADGL